MKKRPGLAHWKKLNVAGQLTQHQSHFFLKKTSGTMRLEPRPARWKAWALPLCYADPPPPGYPIFCLFLSFKENKLFCCWIEIWEFSAWSKKRAKSKINVLPLILSNFHLLVFFRVLSGEKKRCKFNGCWAFSGPLKLSNGRQITVEQLQSDGVAGSVARASAKKSLYQAFVALSWTQRQAMA